CPSRVAATAPHAVDHDVVVAAAPPAVNVVFSDLYGLDLLFEEDSCIFCQWCGESFFDLSSSTVHIFFAHVAGDNSVFCGSCFSFFF
ncbi:hypothetical protein Tco_0285862, partial [Tanacetum coccineum]